MRLLLGNGCAIEKSKPRGNLRDHIMVSLGLLGIVAIIVVTAAVLMGLALLGFFLLRRPS